MAGYIWPNFFGENHKARKSLIFELGSELFQHVFDNLGCITQGAVYDGWQ